VQGETEHVGKGFLEQIVGRQGRCMSGGGELFGHMSVGSLRTDIKIEKAKLTAALAGGAAARGSSGTKSAASTFKEMPKCLLLCYDDRSSLMFGSCGEESLVGCSPPELSNIFI
jgi:hypothetical protein